MTTSQAYYEGLAQDQVKNCMSNRKLKNMMDENYSMKKRWDEVQTEKDIEDLTYFYMAKRRQWEGCVGASTAQDALDFIHANRDKKIHELGEIYLKPQTNLTTKIMKTYYFDTGVKIGWGTPPVVLHDGEVLSSNGVRLIPFECEGVPDNAIFKFAADDTPPFSSTLHKAKIHNSKLVSEYAFFLIPQTS